MQATEKERLANRSSTAGAQPIPEIILPRFPEKLRRIDPEGCDAWQKQFSLVLKDWVSKMNTVNQNLADKIKT